MVAVLGDGVVFRCPTSGNSSDSTKPGGIEAEYLEETPVEYFNQRFDALPRLSWHFGYAQQRQGLHESMEHGTLFQVHLWWYPGDCAALAPNAAPMKDHSTVLEYALLFAPLQNGCGSIVHNCLA
jgi:hypothetical protein